MSPPGPEKKRGTRPPVEGSTRMVFRSWSMSRIFQRRPARIRKPLLLELGDEADVADMVAGVSHAVFFFNDERHVKAVVGDDSFRRAGR